MIEINEKRWNKLRASDIQAFLLRSEGENFFFEFKSDRESPRKLMKEVSAFANTFGGYIFLGVEDDRTVSGCREWTEQRIHTAIHDSLTPVPVFDVRKFVIEGKTVLVLRVEEGGFPPYVTNEGSIYERVSSGSYPIKDTNRLTQLFNKMQSCLEYIENKIEIEQIRIDSSSPANLCAYIDMGFSVTCSRNTRLAERFFDFDYRTIAEYLRKNVKDFGISMTGESIVVSVGYLMGKRGYDDKETALNNGIQNYIEIMQDGSVKCRIILSLDPESIYASITGINFCLKVFSDVYSLLFGDDFSKIFISARKYERLTVVRQFIPYYYLDKSNPPQTLKLYAKYLPAHQQNYGNNLIINSNRIPTKGYYLVDKRNFTASKIPFNSKNLFDLLFYSSYANLGYIDSVDDSDSRQGE